MNLITLCIRIFVTYKTSINFNPDEDTDTIPVLTLMIVISLSDWLTPYSLILFYYKISNKEESRDERSFSELASRLTKANQEES
jgi:hypothetical protein